MSGPDLRRGVAVVCVIACVRVCIGMCVCDFYREANRIIVTLVVVVVVAGMIF